MPDVAKPKVYVASPYGFSQSTYSFRLAFNEAIKKAGCDILDPWRHNPSKLPPWEKLGAINAADIERADGIVAALDGVDVDSGTAAEIGYAAALGKWIIGYRGDFRKAGEDPKVVVNLQVQYFIEKNGGTIIKGIGDKKLNKDLDKLTAAIRKRIAISKSKNN
jgi:nucleoside 2-deoxyribosyltransferase